MLIWQDLPEYWLYGVLKWSILWDLLLKATFLCFTWEAIDCLWNLPDWVDGRGRPRNTDPKPVVSNHGGKTEHIPSATGNKKILKNTIGRIRRIWERRLCFAVGTGEVGAGDWSTWQSVRWDEGERARGGVGGGGEGEESRAWSPKARMAEKKVRWATSVHSFFA